MFKTPTPRLFCALLITLGSVLLSTAAHAYEATNVADTFVATATPAYSKLNFGRYPTLNVTTKQNTYLQFALETLPADASSTKIKKATLRFWVSRVVKPGTVKISSAGDGSLLSEYTVNGSNAPALGGTIATAALTAADTGNFVTVDVTSYLRSLSITSASFITLALSQNTADSTYIILDSKENTVTSHGAQLFLDLDSSVVAEVGHLSGTPASTANLTVGSYRFMSTLAGIALKANESVLIISNVELASAGATNFEVNVGRADTLGGAVTAITADQDYTYTAAFGPANFARTAVFTAPADGSYVIGMAIKYVSGSPVLSSSHSDVTLIRFTNPAN